jgi:glycerol-3-phosphate cytidylyltransferase
MPRLNLPALNGVHNSMTNSPSQTAATDNETRVVTFGTFDVFHVGHLRILERAKSLGDRLIVGISTDNLTFQKKGRQPVFTESERMQIVAALRCVDEVFLEESLELKREYLIRHRASILAMGDDWAGKFDGFGDTCKVVYFERTPAISTTAVIEKIRL